MKLSVLFLFISSILLGCHLATVKSTQAEAIVKKGPEFVGIDDQIKKYYDEYILLSKRYHVVFSKRPTIGLKKITDKATIFGTAVIAQCRRSEEFQEISVDTKFWDKSDEKERRMTIFHELGHCMCGRDHDYAEGKFYQEKIVEQIIDYIWQRASFQVPEGYYNDYCPKSLMHPIIPDDSCLRKHYNGYLKELFTLCKPI